MEKRIIPISSIIAHKLFNTLSDTRGVIELLCRSAAKKKSNKNTMAQLAELGVTPIGGTSDPLESVAEVRTVVKKKVAIAL